MTEALTESAIRAKAEAAVAIFAAPGQESQAAPQQAFGFALERHTPAAGGQRRAWPTSPPQQAQHPAVDAVTPAVSARHPQRLCTEVSRAS